MAHRLSTRILGIVLIAHLVLIPALAVGLELLVRRSHVQVFVDSVSDTLHRHTYVLEHGGLAAGDDSLRMFLDDTLLDGQVVYAQVTQGVRRVGSTHNDPRHDGHAPSGGFSYARGQENLYFAAESFTLDGTPATLELGFDETETGEQILRIRRQVLATLAAWLAVEIVLGLLLARSLVRPLERLRDSADRVAGGDLATPLYSGSNIVELEQLGSDLDRMRNELVGAGERMARQLEERHALEQQVQRKQRLETVGTMASGLAHELNNVLLPIGLYAETAVDALPEGHVSREAMQRVLALSARASDIIGKVLAFGRGQLAPPERAGGLASVVQEALGSFEILRPAAVALESRLDAQCNAIAIEPTQVTQLVLNLCANALHAVRDRGGGRIVVTLRMLPPGDESTAAVPGAAGCAELVVADNGVGIEPHVQERIFDPFFTTRAAGEGSGLGLSVVHGIVSRLGGRITVHSKRGEGATFTVLLPARTGTVLPDVQGGEPRGDDGERG